MPKTLSFEDNLLKLIFNQTAWSNIATSTGATSLWLSLHSADPGKSGTQSTSEVSYTGYARVSVARTTSGWTVTNANVIPVSSIAFATCTAGGSAQSPVTTARFFGVGLSQTGTGTLLYYGSVSPAIPIYNTITPILSPVATITDTVAILRGA
jgi:hypothetical protein